MESAELLAYLKREITAFVEGSTGNYISIRTALTPKAAGMKLFDDPLIAVGAADDPLFAELQGKTSGKRRVKLPSEWMENAQCVISYFLPMTEHVRASNVDDGPVSPEWLHVRSEGQMLVVRLGEHIERLARENGFEAICPACHPDGSATSHGNGLSSTRHGAWPERHIAHLCGLGTFSLSGNIITEKGAAGLLGSVVVSAALPTTTRAYTDLDEYCIKCGTCAKRCPVDAISLETGKDVHACHRQITASTEQYPGYFGCGKCQVGVPCEHARP